MKTANFQYKCRLCGKQFSNSAIGEQFALAHMMNAIFGYKLPESFAGGEVSKIDLHTHCELGCGIADLIGYTISDGERL